MTNTNRAANDTPLRLTRIAAGRYSFNGFAVDRIGTAWRWYRLTQPNTGGEWRASRREATLDLAEYVGMMPR